MPSPFASGLDDVARHLIWASANGHETGGGQRNLRAAGARHHWRPGGIGGVDRVHCAGGLSSHVSQGKSMKTFFLLTLAGCLAWNAAAQEPLTLTLAEAQQLALKQHPDI